MMVRRSAIGDTIDAENNKSKKLSLCYSLVGERIFARSMDSIDSTKETLFAVRCLTRAFVAWRSRAGSVLACAWIHSFCCGQAQNLWLLQLIRNVIFSLYPFLPLGGTPRNRTI
jgi:hypothetical protein